MKIFITYNDDWCDNDTETTNQQINFNLIEHILQQHSYL